MVRPERRTKADVLAAAAIVVVVAAAASLIWWTSDARATISRPAAVPAPNPTPAREVPASLKQLWTAASPADRRARVVAGRSPPATDAGGRARPGHRQSRGATPATATCAGSSWVYHYAVAVYQDDRGCGQVSTHRWIHRPPRARPQQLRRSAGQPVLRRHDGVVGRRSRLELWRSDMVRMLAYGETDARVKPSFEACTPDAR